MKYPVVALTLLSALFAASLNAADGVPSQAKLNRLGLGSLQMSSEHQGSQVRGRFYFRYSYNGQIADSLTTTATFGDVVTDGVPLSYTPPTVFPVIIMDGLGPITDTDGITTHTGETNINFSISNTATSFITPPVFNPPMFNVPTFPGFGFP